MPVRVDSWERLFLKAIKMAFLGIIGHWIRSWQISTARSAWAVKIRAFKYVINPPRTGLLGLFSFNSRSQLSYCCKTLSENRLYPPYLEDSLNSAGRRQHRSSSRLKPSYCLCFLMLLLISYYLSPLIHTHTDVPKSIWTLVWMALHKIFLYIIIIIIRVWFN